MQSVDEVKNIIAEARKVGGAGPPGAVVGGIETDEYIDDAMDGMVSTHASIHLMQCFLLHNCIAQMRVHACTV